MQVIDYFLIFVSIILIWSFGRIFVKSTKAGSFLAGLIIIASILAALARFASNLSRVAVGVAAIIGVVKLIIDWQYKNIHIHLNKRQILVVATVFVGCLLTLGYHHYHFFIYEMHDVLYGGAAFEMLTSDYFGNLRVPVLYPNELSSFHLLPIASISAVGFLLPKPTLVNMMEVRYILLAIFIADAVFQIREIKNYKWIWYIPVLLLIAIVYLNSFQNPQTNSGFLYFFVLLQITILVLKITVANNLAPDRINAFKLELVFFSIFLIICKAPLFYSAFLMAVYFWILLSKKRWNWRLFFAGTLIVLNMLTWVIVPQGHERSDIKFINPLTYYGVNRLNTMITWAWKDNVHHSLKSITGDMNYHSEARNLVRGRGSIKNRIWERQKYLVMFLGIFVLIILKYYAPFFTFFALTKKKKWWFGIGIYMSLSLFGWIFFRPGGSMESQVYSYLFAAIVSALVLIQALPKWRFSIAILFPIALFYMIGGRHPASNTYFGRKNMKRVMRLKDVPIIRNGMFYVPPSDEPAWKTEIIALVNGLRVRTSAYNKKALDGRTTKVHHFVLGVPF